MGEQEPYHPVRVRPVTRADHIIYPMDTWALILTALGIPGIVILAQYLPMATVHLVARYVFIAAVLTDVSALYLTVTYLLRGGGLHGIPLIAPAFYVVFIVYGMGGAWWWRLFALAGLIVLHVGCQLYLPRPIARRLGWRPGER